MKTLVPQKADDLFGSKDRSTAPEEFVRMFLLKEESALNRLSEARQGLEQLAAQQAAAIGQERVEVLLGAAREVDSQMVAACEPLLASVSDSVEAILLTMHKEDFSGEVAAVSSPAPPCSLYMRELQAFMERISKDFLSIFTCTQFLATQLQPLAERTIHRFVLQGSLVRPLGSGGAMRLASDCAQLEFGLSSILGPSGQSSLGPTGLTALGGSYRLLRAFRALLFLTPEDVVSFPGLGSTLALFNCPSSAYIKMSRDIALPPRLPLLVS